MSRETEITCPSGLQVVMRSLKGKDIDKLKERRKMATGEALMQVLDDCTVKVIEKSIYDKLPTFSWMDALIGDSTRAIVALRQATSGDEYDFNVRCSDRSCRQPIRWSLNLSDLVTRKLPPTSAEAFLNGNVFEAELGGTKIRYRLNTGRSRSLALKYAAQLDARKKDDEASTEGRALFGLATKIISIDGVDNVLEWLNDQYLDEIEKLAKKMDSTDCGVETTIHVVCSGTNGCGLKQEVELPLDRTFFIRKF